MVAKTPPKTEGQQGGFQDFTLVSRFTLGYRNREDRTVLPPGILVAGSQNVLTNTFQRVGIRKGYTLDGQSNTDLAPIGGQGGAMGVFDWISSQGVERNMRAGFLTSAGNDGKLQFRSVQPDGSVEWLDLLTGLTSIDFNFITFWDEDSLELQVLMVNGDKNIRSWSGLTTTVASATNDSGIIGEVDEPGDLSQILVSGGMGYTAGDLLTLTGGGNNATVSVDTVTTGAIATTSFNPAGSGYAIGDEFSIAGGTGGNFAAIGQVTAVGGGGTVTSFTFLGRGTGYSAATAVATTNLSGTGTGLKLDINTVSGGAISSWSFVSDADHGTGYANNTTYPLAGGTGSDAHIRTKLIVSGTITKSGTQTWAEAGFFFGVGPKEVVINGTTYTYDGQDFIGDTTTLYGVTPDPSGLVAGDLIVDAVITWPISAVSAGIDLIATLDSRVLIASKTDVLILISDANNFKTYDPTLTFVLTSQPTSMVIQSDALYISAGRNEWYQIVVEVAADLASSAYHIYHLNTAIQQAAQSQASTNKIANSVVFLSFEPIIETFGPVQDIFQGPQMTDYSFPIVNDTNTYDWTNACVYYYRKFVYIAVPRENLVLVYNMTDSKNPYWEAPQVMPISRFSVIEGDLYGHSSQVSETYKLFNGTNDNGHPIVASAIFSFNNYGTRSQSKGYNEFYCEGYASANTVLTLGVQYDIDGCATNTYFPINGNDRQIVCIGTKADNSLGKFPLGTQPLGSAVVPSTEDSVPKFRVIKTFPIRYFYEDQISFSSSGIDEQWEIVAFGPQLQPYTDLNNSITQ